MAAHPEEADGFDDGLVHSHGWACSDRNRGALTTASGRSAQSVWSAQSSR